MRAFAEYAKTYGEQELISILGQKEENGALYHYPGKLTGDYDLFQTQEELFQFLREDM